MAEQPTPALGALTERAKEGGMSLLRNIGNRLRRHDDSVGGGGGGGGGVGGGAPPTMDSATSSMGGAAMGKAMLGGAGAGDEQPDLYTDDRDLGHSIRELEEVRQALQALTNAAAAHKESLVSAARTETLLGEHLGDMLQAGPRAGSADSLTLAKENAGGSPRHFARFLRDEDREAQCELGRGLGSHATSTVKLANAFANPLVDLQRTFEDRFLRKITPLRKQYAQQKGQYLKYRRQSEMADADERRSYYEALAEAAKPVWQRTSTELKTECNVMTELTARNMAKWSRALALQQERALAVAAANFAEAFQQAKANNVTG